MRQSRCSAEASRGDDQLPEHGAVEVKPAEDDAWLTIGCQCLGSGQTVMPGHRRAVERPYTGAERAALVTAPDTLGDTTYDIHLNDNAYWRNVPAAMWNYRLGRYQVLKKWLSYRERKVLGQELRVEEVGCFSEVARRIRAILSVISSEQPPCPDHKQKSIQSASTAFDHWPKLKFPVFPMWP